MVTFQESQQEEMEVFKTKLLSCIGELVQSFVTAYGSSLVEATSTLKNQMEEEMKGMKDIDFSHRKGLGLVKSSFATSMVEIDAKTTSFQKSFVTLNSASITAQKDLLETVLDHSSQLVESLHSNTTHAVASLNSAVECNARLLEEALSDHACNSQVYTDQYHIQSDHTSTEMCEACKQINEDLQNSLLPLRECASVWKEEVPHIINMVLNSYLLQILTLQKSSSDFSTFHTTDLDILKGAISTFKLDHYEQTGSTPSKSSKKMPNAIIGTRADEEIIAQHRNNGVPVKIESMQYMFRL